MAMNDFNERLQNAAKAKLAMHARASAKAPTNSPDFGERQAERVAVSAAREQRKAESAERKLAEAARVAEEKAAAAALAQLALEAEKAAKEAELNKAKNDAIALKAAQKAGRDAKYAARQARRDARRSPGK